MSAAPRLALYRAGPASDRELVEEVLAGRDEAYATLVERHQEALFRHAWGMLGDADAAADMVQDTLVRAYARLASCRERDRFDAWLFQILRNRCRDQLKTPWWRRRTPIEAEPSLRAPTVDPLGSMERVQAGREVERALAALPAAQREAFLLKHVDELSYEEMSERLGTGVSALKMRVMRAREALQALLADRPDHGCDPDAGESSSQAEGAVLTHTPRGPG